MKTSPGRSRRSTGSSSKKSGSGGGYRLKDDDSGDDGKPKAKTDEQMNRIKQYIGMHQSPEGRQDVIERLCKESTITEIEAKELLENFGIKLDGEG